MFAPLLSLCVCTDSAFLTPSQACQGYGSRLGQRLEAIADIKVDIHSERDRPVTGGQALLQSLYSSFVDTAFRSFTTQRWSPGNLPLQEPSRRVEFESEAERWIAGFSQDPRATVAIGSAFDSGSNESSSSGSASNESLTTASSTMESSATNSSSTSPVASALRSCLGLLHQTLMAKVDARPPTFVQAPERAEWNGLVMLSGGDRNAALAERVVANHAAFAARHKYAYWWYRGSLVEDRGWQPYWHKIAMLRRALIRFPAAHAFAWIDDDIIVTNHRHDMLRSALKRTNASVIVTRDAAQFATLNTGIILVRNDAAGQAALDELWRRATAFRADGVTLATDPQSRCLHEQQALQEMLKEPHWRARVAVLAQRDAPSDEEPLAMPSSEPAVAADARGVASGVPQLRPSPPPPPRPRDPQQALRVERPTFNLNTFLRWTHYNAERNEQMRFEGDAHGSGWLRGDFAGHCSGLSPVRRALCVGVLLGSVVT